MVSETPENRPPAPGALGVVQEFMNSGHLSGRGEISPELAAAIRVRHEIGVNHASIAAELGVGQKFVAAIARGASLGDDLATPESATTWLAARDLLPDGTSIDGSGPERLREFRELLRALALANNGAPLEPGVLQALDEVAARHPLVAHFETHSRAALRPLGDGTSAAVGVILVIVFEAMRDGSFQRLKRCAGDGCPHTFYDASRNRTGTWCAMSVCGNRTKVRAYQRRRRTAGRGATT